MCSKSFGTRVCFKYFHGAAEIIQSWLLKLYWALWSEFNLGLQSAAWDSLKAPSPSRGMCCPRAWPCMGVSLHLSRTTQERMNSSHIFPPSPGNRLLLFLTFGGRASLLLPCAIAALLPKKGKGRKKIIRAGSDCDKGFILGEIFLKHEIMWVGERHKLIEMRKSLMEITKT